MHERTQIPAVIAPLKRFKKEVAPECGLVRSLLLVWESCLDMYIAIPDHRSYDIYSVFGKRIDNKTMNGSRVAHDYEN